MDDLIERKDALMELIALRKDNAEHSCENDIMRGKDIAYENAMDIIARISAVNRWIPCSERLPEDGQRVLICSKSKRLFDVVFRANAQMPSFETKIFGKVYGWRCEDVIKWMPMPEPTEKEEENEQNQNRRSRI